MSEKRTCRRCKVDKPVNQFEKDKRSKGGSTNRCLKCKQASNNKAYKAFYRMRELAPKYPIPIETTKEEVAQLFDVFDNRCGYCNVEESEETGTFNLEHIRPLSRGKARHHVSNLFISCKSCNSRKGDKPVLTFYREHGKLEYDYMPFLVKYIARFSKRSIKDVEAELVDEERDYHESRDKAAV
ncbi:HNH endonuclease [Rossellomorea sp. GCM10028870]|uniref:HNH endonuclease n=1 Tax=Rossellomorea sp. GCM10028870 TaxID=3273426 RepID=UPI00361C4824